MRAIDGISAIHRGVEHQRGRRIPDWAYRDVLFMLIDYSVRAYELLERKLDTAEREEVFQVFRRVGLRMQINGLPATHGQWVIMRKAGLREHLSNGAFTKDLYKQYRRHLGRFRFLILKQVQRALVPERVNRLLGLGHSPIAALLLDAYKLSRILRLDPLLKNAILPSEYKAQVKALDRDPGN